MNDRKSGEVWTVNADVALQSVSDDPGCPELLRRALTDVHSWQVRNETTVGRALKVSRLMPEWLAALLALGAAVTMGEGGAERYPDTAAGQVPLGDVLGGEVEGQVMALHIPIQGPHSRWGEARVARTPGDEPIVAAFVAVSMDTGAVREARIALTGVWPEPAQLADVSGMLIGGPLSGDRIQAVAAAVEKAVAPQGDYLGSADYRRAMAGVLTRRALEACAAAPTAGGGR